MLPDPFVGKLKDALTVLPVSSLVYDNEVFFLATLISPQDLLQRLHEKEFMGQVHKARSQRETSSVMNME